MDIFNSKDAKRVITAGHNQACEELNNTHHSLLDEGNPNHSNYNMKLFGYDVDVFMAKQYK